MLREHKDLVRRAYATAEIFCVFFAWSISYYFLGKSDLRSEPFGAYFFPFAAFVFVFMFFLSARRVYPEDLLSSFLRIFYEQVVGGLLGTASVFFIYYFLNLKYLYQPCLLMSCAFSVGFVMVWSFFVRCFYEELWREGRNFKRLLLVGNGYTLPPVIRSIQRNPNLGQKIEAILLLGGEAKLPDLQGVKIYSGEEELTGILNQHVLDNVFFTVYRQNPLVVEQAMLKCQERGLGVWLKPDFMHGALISSGGHLADMPIFVFSMGPKMGVRLALKRFLDVLCSGLLLILLGLPLLAVAMLIKNTPGDVFFLQKRMGLNGRRFVIAKFRTMYKDSEQRREEYNLKNEMQGVAFKMKNDPRITPIGKILRKYSVDELPQLWNVFKGDMSIVGPRPLPCYEMEQAKGWQRRRLSMRPGITCIWQVTGRNKIRDFNEWAKLDLEYIDKWSLLLDLKILLKTIPAVFGGTGI